MATGSTNASHYAVWGLGLSQIIGFGTLYYSFAILAPSISAELDLPQQWAFGVLSLALFLGSLLAPLAGRMADRFGGPRVMTAGSIGAALAFLGCALAPERLSFGLALIAAELAACFVLYPAAFVTLVQMSSGNAARSITLLTLVGGFASTVFWPLTSWLHGALGWRETYLIFAALNLVVCLPVHAALLRFANRRAKSVERTVTSEVPRDLRPNGAMFRPMLAGFAIAGFVFSAILLHMVPLLAALGMGTAGVIVSTLFGPAQVASRIVNMVFGGRLPQRWLAVVSASLPLAGLLVLVVGGGELAAVVAFVVLVGMGSGLFSIVGGTLPLEVFGRDGYGGNVGWMNAARQFSSAFAPFAMALMIASTDVTTALAALTLVTVGGTALFFLVAKRVRPRV